MIGQFISDVVGGQVCPLSYSISQLQPSYCAAKFCSYCVCAWYLLVNGASLVENKLFYLSGGKNNIILITYPISVGLKPTVLGSSFGIIVNFLMLILSVMFNCLYSLRHSTSLLFLKFMTSLMFILSASLNFFIHIKAPAAAGFEQLV